MIENTMKADASILTNLFNGLLQHSVLPPAWKEAKCVPIPKPGRTDLSIPKNLRPILRLFFLSKTVEKILTQRIAWTSKLSGASTPDHFRSRAGHSAIDTLMMTLTPVQEWLLKPSKRAKSSKGPTPMRLYNLANDIEGVFNCMVHELQLQIMTHYKLPRKSVATIADFNSNREMCMSLDGETELNRPPPWAMDFPKAPPCPPYCSSCTHLPRCALNGRPTRKKHCTCMTR